MSKIITKKIILCFFCILLFSSYASARNVTLQWDTNDDADYYVVYWGEVSGNYIYNSSNIDAPATGYTTDDLEEKTWYFAVKAFNCYGNSSDFSDEVISAPGSGESTIDLDSDDDGIPDYREMIIGTDVNNKDTDGDGTEDGAEYLNYYVDTNGNVIIPDTDGDGTYDIADTDDDNDGISDEDENEAGTDPYFSTKMNHVDTIYIIENGDPTIVILKTITSSNHPVCEIINRTEDYTRLIEFGYDNYWAIKILYNFGNLDNEGGNEIAVLMQNRSTGEMLEEIRDIQTGAIYTFPGTPEPDPEPDPEPEPDHDNDGLSDAEDPDDDNDGFSDEVEIAAGSDPLNADSTPEPEPEPEPETPATLCNINAIKHRYFKTGTEIAEVGFCEETQRTIVRLYSISNGQRTFVSDTIFLGIGIRPLNMVLIDTDNDGIEEIIVMSQNSEDDTIAKVTGLTITVQ